MIDPRDKCGCHRECTTEPHSCSKPCKWPECLTKEEHQELAKELRENDMTEPKYKIDKLKPGIEKQLEDLPADKFKIVNLMTEALKLVGPDELGLVPYPSEQDGTSLKVYMFGAEPDLALQFIVDEEDKIIYIERLFYPADLIPIDIDNTLKRLNTPKEDVEEILKPLGPLKLVSEEYHNDPGDERL